MQTYAPTTTIKQQSSSNHHHRSVSLCNYDELFSSTRKRSVGINSNNNNVDDDLNDCSLTQRKNMNNNNNQESSIESYQCKHHYNNEVDERNYCEQCPLNSSSNINDNHLKKESNTNNDNNKKCSDESTIIDMLHNDQSLRILFYPLKFSCSSSCFLKSSMMHNNNHHHHHQPPLSSSISNQTSSVKGHRRSLSLRQQFEYGYDYLRSEWEQARELAGKTVETVTHATGAVWKVCHFNMLPKWMQDNEYLHTGHRPPLPTFWECIKSIFRLHTETGNIWTHGIGALLFVGLFIYEFVTISAHKGPVDRLMLTIYFCGIILCLFFSCMFHTFSCYASPKVIKIFSKLDYCGISIQIIGSMTPALYYGFYEDLKMFKIYISFGIVLCILSIAVSLWDKFGEPQYRGFRALVFLCFGLSNVIPGVHWYLILDSELLTAYYLFILQGALYVIGSLLYANRIPERLFPGKCDYMFQSHQIFHVLVVLAAFVHLNGINLMAEYRLHNPINIDNNNATIIT